MGVKVVAESGAAAAIRSGRRSRIASLDLARLILALVVAVGHTLLYVGIPDSPAAALLNGLGRLVVPYFLVLSGYWFALRVTTGDTFRSWAGRVLRLYLFWTAVYLPFLVTLGEFSVAKLVFYLAVGYAHLWYLPALLGGGVLLWAVRHWRDSSLLALALGLFATGLAVQLALNLSVDPALLPHRNAWLSAPRNFLFFGFPCLATGFLLARSGVLADRGLASLAPLLAAGVFALIGEALLTYRLFGLDGFGDLFVSAIVVAPLIVLSLRLVRLDWVAPWVGPLSSAIYFVHPLFIFLIATVGSPSLPVQVVLVLVLSAAAGGGLVRLSRRVPLI